MGYVTDYYVGIGVEERHRKTKLEAERKAACENSTLGKIFKATVFEKPPAGKEIKPFDLTKVDAQIAEKTHDAVSGVLNYAYGPKDTPSGETLGEKLKADIDALDKHEKTIENDVDSATFVLLRGFITSIKKAVEKPVSEFSLDDVHSLRTNISSALNLINNNEALFGKYEGFVQFLEALSYQITTQVEGMSILESMGEQALAWCNDPSIGDGAVSIAKIASHVEEAFHHFPAKDWDTTSRWLKWVKSNPQEAFFAQLDNHIPGCHVLYNSHNQGNVNVFYGQCKVGKLGDDGYKIIRMYIGAGAMNDPAISEAAMKWGTRKGEIHVAHTLEFKEKKGEASRWLGLKALIEKINDIVKRVAVFFVSTTQDGTIEKGKGKFSKIASVEDFHENLKATGWAKQREIKDIKDYEGFDLPRKLLSDDDIDEAFEFSEKALKAALSETGLNKNSTAKYNQRLCSALLANFNAFLEVKMLINLGNMRAENEISEATYSMVCKQCFDRGPLANAILMAYVKLLDDDNNGKLYARDEKQILGLLAGRTMMGGGDRKMVKNRRQTFIDLFNIIGKNQSGFVKNLQEFAKGGGNDWIKFVPSNHTDPIESPIDEGYSGETEDSDIFA